MTRARSGGLLVSLALAAGTLCRQASAADPATATMLFNEGRRLVSAGHYPEACPKFEESERLDPGIGTQFNLADCYQHIDRFASAWALFLDVASSAGGTGQQARENLARKRALALEPKVSKLMIATPRNSTGLEVRRNGEPVRAMLWNSPVPVDPGSYTVEASAPHKKRWSTVASVGPNGVTVTVAVPELETDDTPAAAPPAPTEAAATAAPVDSDAAPAEATRGNLERTIALGAGGAGIVAIGIGAAFGLRSIAKHSDYESLCHAGSCQAAAGPLHDQAVSAGNVSTVTFTVGGALAAGGVVLWLLAPRASSDASASRLVVAPAIGSSSAGAVVSGAW
jgi:hypothetical protein